MADEKDGRHEPVNAKIILVAIREKRNRYDVAKVLAQQLGVSFEEGAELIRELPAELIPSIPIEAGERFADMLRKAGGEVDVMSTARAAGHFCSDHTHRRARAKCKDPTCQKYICEICVRNAHGHLLCAEHYAALVRRRLFLAIVSVACIAVTVVLSAVFGSGLRRWFSSVYEDTLRVAIVFVSRDLKGNVSYYTHMTTSEAPGGYSPREKHDYRDIEGWFQREYERHAGNQMRAVEITIFGLYELVGDPPQPSRSSHLSWINYKVDRKFRQFFDEVARVNDLELNKFHDVLFVELVKDTGIENDYMEQLGVVKNGLGFVRIPTTGRLSNDYYVMSVAHYVGRLLGASLKLDEHGFPVFPYGYGEPDASPRYPQSAVELMGCYQPLRAFEIGRINTLDQVVIGPESASELHWIPRAKADSFYRTVRP